MCCLTSSYLCMTDSTPMKYWTLSTKIVPLPIVFTASILSRSKTSSLEQPSTTLRIWSGRGATSPRQSLSIISKKISAANRGMEFKSRLGRMMRRTRSWCTCSAYFWTWHASTPKTSAKSSISSSSTTYCLSTLTSRSKMSLARFSISSQLWWRRAIQQCAAEALQKRRAGTTGSKVMMR